MQPKGIVAQAENGKYYCQLKTSFFKPYKTLKDKDGDILYLRFKNSAIEYLVRNFHVPTKNVKIQ